MSLKKLFGAVSVAALVAGGAHADLLAAPGEARNVAEENNFAATAGVVGDASTIGATITDSVYIQTDNPLPVSQGLQLEINITGSGAFGSGGNAFDPTTALTVAATSATGAIANQIVSTGGGAGETSVVVLFDVTAADVGDATNELILNFPIQITDCSAPVSLSINLRTSTGQPIEGGTASLQSTATGNPALNLFTCVDAYDVTLTADATNPVLLELDTDFQNFGPTGGTGTATLAQLEYEVDTSALVGPTLGANADSDDITGTAFDVVFASDDGFGATPVALPALGGGFATAVAINATGSPTFEITTGAAPTGQTTGTNDLDLTAANTTAAAIPTGTSIAPQQPTIVDATYTLDGTAGLVTANQAIGTNTISEIALEGANFGPFDWVPDATFTPITVFRGTGFDPTDIPDAVVTITNSSNNNNGTWPIDISGLVSTGGQIVVTSQNLQGLASGMAIPDWGIGDITLTFFTSDTLDVDRLLSTEGVVSAFGDTGNSAPGTVQD